MDNEFAMNFTTNDKTACADCKNRLKDNKKAGFCKVYEKTPKPGRVFRGIPCDYYVKGEPDG